MAPGTVYVSASAVSNQGYAVTQIDLLKNNALVATEYSDYLSATLTNLPAGSYTFRAEAYDELGGYGYKSQTIIITAPANQPPTVSLATNGTSFVAPAAILLTATASDSDGTIDRVEFYNGATLIGTDASVPYAMNWSGVGAGTYSLTAKAFDNATASTTSSPVSVTVTNPVSDAQFIGQTVSTQMQTGAVQSVSVQMKNTGNTTWSGAASYRLGSRNPFDNTTWGLNRVNLPQDIAPGQTATFNFNITAPATAGTYNFQWGMVQDGVAWFGAQSANAAIQVTAPPPPSVVGGNIDGIDGAASVVGWACSTYRNDPITVHLYVGGAYGTGTYIGAYNANLASEPAVAAACSASGTNYRFSIPLGEPVRQQYAGQKVYIHGISPVGGANALLNQSGVFAVPAMPPPPPPATTGTRTEVIEYHDDPALWVLGQQKKLTVNGTVVSETTFTAKAQPATVASFGLVRQTLTYNTDGTVATVKDGNNNVTTLSNWKRGIPQNIQYADGATESAYVDDNGWIAWVTDETGSKTCYAYDAMGRISQITYPSEAAANTCNTSAWNATTQTFVSVASAEYGIAAGHWRQTVTTGSYKKVTYYDALWRPVAMQEEDTANSQGTLRWSSTNYDHEGRVVYRSYPRNPYVQGWNNYNDPLPGTWTEYDSLGRVASVAQDTELSPSLQVTITQYLPGFQIRVIDPKGNPTTTSYLTYDQPATDFPVAINHPEGAYTEIYRDAFGKPTSIVRRNGDNSKRVERNYVYDGYQQLCKAIEPETGATWFGYDGAGNLVASAAGLNLPATGSCNATEASNSGRVVSRSYDARNRLSTLGFPDGRGNQVWTYTPDGLPGQITTYNDPGNGAPVVNAYSYNRRRLLTGESSTQTGWYTWGLGYGYNPNGHLTTQSYPTGLVVTYSPNALGQPTAVASTDGWTYASGISYYPNGAIKQFTYGNGVAHTMTQNARQLPLRSTDTGASVLEYAYDANANVTAIWDIARGGDYNRVMAYDGLDRLTSAQAGVFGGSDWTHRFTYDALDNLTSWKLSGVKDYAQYVYDGQNRLGNIKNSAGATIVGLGYDAQGNLQNKNGQLYGFDYGNRLREVAGKEHYRYDGYGRRVLAWHPTQGNILSIYSQGGQVMFEHNERLTSRKATEHIYLAGSLITTRARNVDNGTWTVSFQHTDALGSPVAVTNTGGTVIERTDWEPYGAAIGKPNYQGVGYTGHVMDGATGLTYMQQRYYDPMLGVFLSVDPVTAYSNPVGAFNRYWYANNNPYKFTDPDGRQSKEKDEGNFWVGVAKGIRDTFAPIVHGVVDPDGTMIDTNYDRVGPGEGQVEQGGYKFGGALAVAEGLRLPAKGVGAGVKLPPQMKTVGRHMSPAELSKMKASGRLQEGIGGQTRVADPANPNAYKAAPAGDVYVEFDVPASRVLPHSSGTGRIPGPNSPDARVPGRNPSDYVMPKVERIKENP